MKKLTPKQERFCQEYLIDLNGTQAILRAGYEMTEKSAATESYKLLRKPEISARIHELRDEQSQRTGITADRVIKELAKIAFSDMRKFAKWGPNGVTLTDSETLSDEEAACISEVSESTSETGRSLKFKVHDKKGALDLLGKHFKLFTEKHEHSGPDGKPIEFKDLTKLSDDDLNSRVDALLKKKGGT